MNLPVPESRIVVPRAQYGREAAGEGIVYSVLATKDIQPDEIDGFGGQTIPFIEEVGRIRVNRVVEPMLEEEDLGDLIRYGSSQDPEIPTSGHFYAARVQMPEVYGEDDEGIDEGPPKFHAYLRLGDTQRPENPEEFDIAEIAIDQDTPGLEEVIVALMASVLRPALRDLIEAGRKEVVTVYTDVPTELGVAVIQSFGFEPLPEFGFEGREPEKILARLSFLGENHLPGMQN